MGLLVMERLLRLLGLRLVMVVKRSRFGLLMVRPFFFFFFPPRPFLLTTPATAIRATLISGRLSQPNQTFFITSALPRAFNEQHWDLLESRLQGWKKALGKIRESIPGGANTFVV